MKNKTIEEISKDLEKNGINYDFEYNRQIILIEIAKELKKLTSSKAQRE